MRTMLIGYDLNKKGQDYDGLIDKIKKIAGDTWWHGLDSTWLLRTTKNAETLRDELLPYIDTNDELLVIDITGDEKAWYGFNKACSDWLKVNP